MDVGAELAVLCDRKPDAFCGPPPLKRFVLSIVKNSSYGLLNIKMLMDSFRRVLPPTLAGCMVLLFFTGLKLKAGDNGSNDAPRYDSFERVLKVLPTVMQDSAFSKELAALPIRSKAWKADLKNGNYTFELISIEPEKYLSGVLCELAARNFSTVESLKANKASFDAIVKALDQAKPEIALPFQDELKRDDNVIYGFWQGVEHDLEAPSKLKIPRPSNEYYVFANGIILVEVVGDNGTPKVAIIPREAIYSATGFTAKQYEERTNLGVAIGYSSMTLIGENGAYEMPPILDICNHEPERGHYRTDKLADLFTTYLALQNLKVVQEKGKPVKAPEASTGKKFMGYSGLSIGMPEDGFLNLLREQVDFARFQPIITIECNAPKKLETNGTRAYLNDIQAATNGLTLIPPWKIHLLSERVTESPDLPFRVDAFVCMDGKLVICGRYVRSCAQELGRSAYYPGDGTSYANVYFDALTTKYGQFSNAYALCGGRNNASLLLFWNAEGALHVGAHFYAPPGVFTFADSETLPLRVKGMRPPRTVENRGAIVPIKADELNIAKLKERQILYCMYFWNDDSEKLIQSRTEQFFNQQDAAKKKVNDLRMQKSIEGL